MDHQKFTGYKTSKRRNPQAAPFSKNFYTPSYERHPRTNAGMCEPAGMEEDQYSGQHILAFALAPSQAFPTV